MRSRAEDTVPTPATAIQHNAVDRVPQHSEQDLAGRRNIGARHPLPHRGSPPDLHWNIADTARTLEMSALVVGATDSAAPADSRYSPLIIQQISIP